MSKWKLICMKCNLTVLQELQDTVHIHFLLSDSPNVMLLTDILHRSYLCKMSESVLSWLKTQDGLVSMQTTGFSLIQLHSAAAH